MKPIRVFFRFLSASAKRANPFVMETKQPPSIDSGALALALLPSASSTTFSSISARASTQQPAKLPFPTGRLTQAIQQDINASSPNHTDASALALPTTTTTTTTTGRLTQTSAPSTLTSDGVTFIAARPRWTELEAHQIKLRLTQLRDYAVIEAEQVVDLVLLPMMDSARLILADRHSKGLVVPDDHSDTFDDEVQKLVRMLLEQKNGQQLSEPLNSWLTYQMRALIKTLQQAGVGRFAPAPRLPKKQRHVWACCAKTVTTAADT